MGIFGNIGKKVKEKAIGAAVKTQLKKLPPEQREMFEALMNNNPELLEKLATESQALMKSGKSQMQAMMEVGKKYQAELAEAMMSAGVDPSKLSGGAGAELKGPFK